MQAQLRVELDELVVAAEALPLAREKEEQWRVVAEQAAGQLSEVRRRCVCVWYGPSVVARSMSFATVNPGKNCF